MEGTMKTTREPKDSKFRQQELLAFRPVLKPLHVVLLYLIVGAILIPLGAVCLDASRSVKELKKRYDDIKICQPRDSSDNRDINQRMKDSGGKQCELNLTVPATLKPPIYVYYELTDYFQNHRRYVKSRNDRQLAGKSGGNMEDCKPKAELDEPINGSDSSRVINPCGLTAWSYFNDTFSIQGLDGIDVYLDENDIAWKTDVEYKFGNYSPVNFNPEGSYKGGGRIEGNVVDDEHFIVWMRTASLSSSFRKLYGVIHHELEENARLSLTIENNYNTYGFGGQKSIILSTTSWLGGQDEFLGVLQLTLGCASLLVGMVYFILHIQFPRKFGDERFLSWAR
eukprot:g5508.t1